MPLPEAWPHHGYVTSDASDPDETQVEIGGRGMRVQLERCFREVAAQANAAPNE